MVQYANATEEELTPEQTIDLQDVIMSLSVNNSKEAEKKLKEALETKGFIRFNKKQMLNSGAFNKYEVKQILNSKENSISLLEEKKENIEEISVLKLKSNDGLYDIYKGTWIGKNVMDISKWSTLLIEKNIEKKSDLTNLFV